MRIIEVSWIKSSSREKIIKQRIKMNTEFYVLQIKNTKEIIETFSDCKEFSLTMLINSLLSLVILPFEKAKKADGKKTFPGAYKELEKKLGFRPIVFAPIKSCQNGRIKYSNKTIYTYINKFRNGIAHQNLDVYVDENKIIYITVYNVYSLSECKKCQFLACKEKGVEHVRGETIDFKITVTVEQLQELALYIADSYLTAIEREK